MQFGRNNYICTCIKIMKKKKKTGIEKNGPGELGPQGLATLDIYIYTYIYINNGKINNGH